jgi:hypothetical protein
MPTWEVEPPPVEPTGYLEWRRSLLTDLPAALERGSNEAKPCLMFFANTEIELISRRKRLEFLPLDDQVIFAWEEDGGVWALEATAEIWDRLELLLGRDLLHWHEALERCGAVHYNNCKALIDF